MESQCEQAIIGGIEQGLADVAAGRTVTHEAATDELQAVIAAARAAKSYAQD